MRWIPWCLLLGATACFEEPDVVGGDSNDGSSSSGASSATSCQDATCSTTVGTSQSSSADATTIPPDVTSDTETGVTRGETDTSSPTSSGATTEPMTSGESATTGAPMCQDAGGCSECVTCTLRGDCATALGECLMDDGCHAAMDCANECLAMKVGVQECLIGGCACPVGTAGTLFSALTDCAATECVGDGSGPCPVLPCTTTD